VAITAGHGWARLTRSHERYALVLAVRILVCLHACQHTFAKQAAVIEMAWTVQLCHAALPAGWLALTSLPCTSISGLWLAKPSLWISSLFQSDASCCMC
jgi:hypothetical protein